MPGLANLSSWFVVENMVVPKEGPRCIRADLDFSVESSIVVEGLLATTTGTISYIQGLYVNNQTNDNPVEILCKVTRQLIIIPANSQGYVPVMEPNDPSYLVSTTPAADLTVQILFYNVPIQPVIWGPNGVQVTGSFLTDAELRAAAVDMALTKINATATAVGNGVVGLGVQRVAIASDNSAIATTPTHPIGGAYTSRSIANLSGASEQLMAANANRRILIVSNEGATAIALNLTGGTAALNTAGNVTLAAGGSLTLDNYPPTGAINIIGTLNADVTAYEG